MREWMYRSPAWLFALIVCAGAVPCVLLALAVPEWIHGGPLNLGYAIPVAVLLSLLGLPGILGYRRWRLRQPSRRPASPH
jgi:asparagine N-glycosylation enzyme membrane subunit Stt3